MAMISLSSQINAAVQGKHASTDVKMYCMYQHFMLGKSLTDLSNAFAKNPTTVSRWINRFKVGKLSKQESNSLHRKFRLEKRQWVVQLYIENPILYLDEAKKLFDAHFQSDISKSSVYNILREAGFTYKVIERRAMQVTALSVYKYTQELKGFNWLVQNLVFLDEVSFDNRQMFRKRGFGLKGKKIFWRGEYCRKPRVSLLCALASTGIIDIFATDGTFDREKVVKHLEQLATTNGMIVPYPGFNSVWIMDGASIHRDPTLVRFLRSLGILVLFLPAYCPFFNPIEIVFGLVKKKLQRYWVEGSKKPVQLAVAGAFTDYLEFDATKIFRKCGYTPMGFDPAQGFDINPCDYGFV
jgi:transposase